MKEKRFQKIYIEITNRCNLKCKFCPDTKRKKEFMQVDTFKEILKKVEPYTNLIFLHVKGEPLLHPELEEILNCCTKRNLQVNLTTNATLLEEKLPILQKQECIRQINISLHSMEQNEKTQEEKELYLDSIFKSVQILQENTNVFISYRLWNTEKIGTNLENEECIRKIGKQYKIENLLERAQEEKAIQLDKRIYFNQDRQFIWPDRNQKKITKKGKCQGLRDQIAILVNGDVVPCCLDQDASIKIGNIVQEELTDILQKEKVKAILNGFRQHQLLHELCQKCDFRTRFGNN